MHALYTKHSCVSHYLLKNRFVYIQTHGTLFAWRFGKIPLIDWHERTSGDNDEHDLFKYTLNEICKVLEKREKSISGQWDFRQI